MPERCVPGSLFSTLHERTMAKVILLEMQLCRRWQLIQLVSNRGSRINLLREQKSMRPELETLT